VRVVAVVLVVSASVALATAPAVFAARIEMPYLGSADAVAGDSVVAARWSEDGWKQRPGPIRIVRRDAQGTVTTLATLPAVPTRPAPIAGLTYYAVTLRSSPTMWAVAIRAWLRPDDSEEAFTTRGEMIATGAVGGGAPRVLARCATTGDGADDEIPMAVAGDSVAWSNANCPGADGVRLAAPADQAVGPQLVGDGSDVALTPAQIGYRFYDQQRAVQQIVLVDQATGAKTPLDTGYVSAFALADSGVAAVIADTKPNCAANCRQSILRVAADGSIVRPGLVATYGGPLVAGGGRVLAIREGGNGVVAADLATGAVSYAGLLGLDPSYMVPIGVDATRAIYAAPRCDGRQVLYIEETIPQAPARIDVVPCPLRLVARTATLHLGTHRARVRIRCPNGCDDSWNVIYRGREIGALFFTAPRGATRSALLQLDEARRLRHLGTVVVTLSEDSAAENRMRPRAPRQPPIRLRLKIRR
jgi:hypothetical protein